MTFEETLYVGVFEGGHAMIMLDRQSDGKYSYIAPNYPYTDMIGYEQLFGTSACFDESQGSIVASLNPLISIFYDARDEYLTTGPNYDSLLPLVTLNPIDFTWTLLTMNSWVNPILIPAKYPATWTVFRWDTLEWANVPFLIQAPWKREEFGTPSEQWNKLDWGNFRSKKILNQLVGHVASELSKTLEMLKWIVDPITEGIIGIIFDPVNATIVDNKGNVMGYQNGALINQIPSGLVYEDNTLFSVYFVPAGNYTVIVTGQENGNYTMDVFWADGNGLVSSIGSYNGTIYEGETRYYSVLMSKTGPIRTVSWEHVFEDMKRNTMLRISTDDKYLQFVAPDKDFGVKYDPKMTVLKRVIIIRYEDNEMRLIATAVDDKTDFCSAIAWDKQTHKIYLLIDKPNC